MLVSSFGYRPRPCRKSLQQNKPNELVYFAKNLPWWVHIGFPNAHHCTLPVIRIFIHFHSLLFLPAISNTTQLAPEFFRETATFNTKLFSFDKKSFSIFFSIFFTTFFLRMLIASYGARVRGSVFKIQFRAFSRGNEYIETSPGFAQLLGENWVQSHKKSIMQ